MIRFTVYYTNNTQATYTMKTQEEVNWFLRNEGDHVKKVSYQ